MTYLLLLLVIFYAALAVVVYDRRPEAASNRALSFYLALILSATLWLLLVGTASDPIQAETSARVALAFIAAANCVVLPYTVVSLHFRGWVYFPRRGPFILKTTLVLLAVSVACVVLLVGFTQNGPLVRESTLDYGIAPTGDGNTALNLTAWLSIVGALVTAALVIAGVVRGYITPRWLGWLYLLVITLSGVANGLLIGVLGNESAIKPGGLALIYIPFVALFLHQIVRFKRRVPLLQVLRSLLVNPFEGALALDANGVVIWASEGVDRFLGVPPAGTVNVTHTSELLGANPLGPVVSDLLVSDQMEVTA